MKLSDCFPLTIYARWFDARSPHIFGKRRQEKKRDGWQFLLAKKQKRGGRGTNLFHRRFPHPPRFGKKFSCLILHVQRLAQFIDGVFLNLADALPRNAEFFADVLERLRLVMIQAVIQLDNFPLPAI